MNKRLTSKYSSIKVAVQAAAIMLFTIVIGLTAQSNGWLYDLFNRLSPLSADQQASVVLVTTSSEQVYFGDELWQPAVERLFAAGAKGIVFGFQPKGLSDDFFYELFSDRRVVLARELARDPVNHQFSVLEPLASSLSSSKIHWGVVTIASDSDGIYRRHKSALTGDITLEQFVATTFASELYPAYDFSHDYLINFLAGRDSLPQVTIDRVVERGVIPELVSGKVVLIGIHDIYQQVGLPTPIASGADSLSLLEYQGFSIDTLLNARPIYSVPGGLVVLFLLSTAILSLILLQWVGIMAAMRVTVAMLVLDRKSVV